MHTWSEVKVWSFCCLVCRDSNHLLQPDGSVPELVTYVYCTQCLPTSHFLVKVLSKVVMTLCQSRRLYLDERVWKQIKKTNNNKKNKKTPSWWPCKFSFWQKKKSVVVTRVCLGYEAYPASYAFSVACSFKKVYGLRFPLCFCSVAWNRNDDDAVHFCSTHFLRMNAVCTLGDSIELSTV